MVERSRMFMRDLLSEALAGLAQRPGRSVLTTLGTVLGIAAFVSILGLTATAGGQIDKRFTALAATEVVVLDIGNPQLNDLDFSFPGDAAARVAALNGVENAGIIWQIPLREHTITSGLGTATNPLGLTLQAAEPKALAAMHPRVRAGRLYDEFHAGRREHVAILGGAAADRLGVSRLDAVPAIFVGGEPFTVVGIVDDLQRRPELLLSVMIPTSTALWLYGKPKEQRAQMLIETRIGAASLVASQASLALRPDAPERFKVLSPTDPRTLRSKVNSDFGALFLVLGAISLIIGMLGIANTTLVAVLERTNEIGLRRSVGARPVHIAMQFLSESTALGLLGGMLGGCLGALVVVLTAVIQQWTAVLAPWTLAAAPAVGALVGLAAGLYPAARAARIEPIEALRR